MQAIRFPKYLKVICDDMWSQKLREIDFPKNILQKILGETEGIYDDKSSQISDTEYFRNNLKWYGVILNICDNIFYHLRRQVLTQFQSLLLPDYSLSLFSLTHSLSLRLSLIFSLSLSLSLSLSYCLCPPSLACPPAAQSPKLRRQHDNASSPSHSLYKFNLSLSLSKFFFCWI